MKGLSFFTLFFQAVVLSLTAKEWKTKITTEEGDFTFGGALLEEEKNLVGKWKGVNQEGHKWEIIRRPNHVYSIYVTWIEEGKKETFFGHGLWAVRDTKFIYADILDLGFETEPEWPIDVKNRIPTGEISVIQEQLKLSNEQKIITHSEDVGESNESKVTSFEMQRMRQFNKVDPLKEAQLFDQIQLARILNIEDIIKFFTDPSYPMDKRIVGKWRTTDNDPDDDGEWNCEFIRRADGTTTTMYSYEEDEEPLLSHGFCSIRNGMYYGVDLIEEDEAIPFNENFLWGDKIAKLNQNEFVTQWIDPERKVLMFLPMLISVTDERINEFQHQKLEKEFRENKHGLEYILKKVK